MQRIVSLLVLLIVAVLIAGCGGDGDEDAPKEFTAAGFPFTFEYPEGWTVTRDAKFNYGSSSSAVRAVTVTYKTPYDQASITQYKLKKTLPEGVNGYQPEVDRIVARLTKEAGGKAGDAEIVEFGGVPGYQYVVEYPAGEDAGTLENRLTFLFKGNDEFQINCQSSAPNRAKLNAGCDQILNSLSFN